MLHTKSQGHQSSGSGEEDFWRVFTIYGHGGHLGHVTRPIWTNFRFPILRSLHMKYEFNWPSSYGGEDVWKCWRTTDGRTDDGRRSHWYTNSSPMSLRLRWAKNMISSAISTLLTYMNIFRLNGHGSFISFFFSFIYFMKKCNNCSSVDLILYTGQSRYYASTLIARICLGSQNFQKKKKNFFFFFFFFFKNFFFHLSKRLFYQNITILSWNK